MGGSSLQQKLDELIDEDPDLCCPVSLMLFAEPVIASDGFIYEKASLTTLLANRQVSPMTRETLKLEYRPAQRKKSKLTTIARNNPEPCSNLPRRLRHSSLRYRWQL